VLGIKKLVSPATQGLTRNLLPRPWSALDLASDGIVLLDSAGQIAEMNAEARRLLNCIEGDLSGSDFWDAVLPEVAERHQLATERAIGRLQGHSFVAHSQFEGDWLEYTFKPYPAGYVVNLKDVTPAQRLQRLLAQSELSNRLLFKSNPNAMWIFDMASLHFIDVNQAAIDFYGISKSNFLTLKLGALFPDGSGAAIFSAVHSEGVATTALQICSQVKGDGSVVLVELACALMTWNGHKVMLGSVADVTERHLSDRTLRRENAELELKLSTQAEALKNSLCDVNAMTFALSHDLQVPLHAANGFASMLDERYGALLDDPGRHYIKRIQASTRKMAGLVNDLRTLVQLPQVPGELETLDVTVLCDAILQDLRARHPNRAVTFESSASRSVVAIKGLLVIALTCLLENAWKFTGKKPDGWISVAILSGGTPGELVLQVSDNGEGFDATYSDKLFTAFQRLHSAADYPGNGLGLITVKRVAERHGGRVWAESTPTGASFYMALPQAQSLDASESVH
jgi:PAS domain S-box-containing protein